MEKGGGTIAAPLADRLRPQTIDEIVGQKHLLAPGEPLRGIIDSGEIPNLIFYGPPGVGKTTLASMIAKQTNKKLYKLNGTTASTADIREIYDSLDTLEGINGVVLYLDEIQYLNKKQQQTLLEFIEKGQITLIASTTENPYFYVYNAILSRCTVFEFKEVPPEEIERAVVRAFEVVGKERDMTLQLEDGVLEWIAASCGGDVRKAINTVELSALSLSGSKTDDKITLHAVQGITEKSAMRYSRTGDEHYDIVSAYQKSMRGSDPDAALHYLARVLEAGDLPSACRRLLVCACEDVGLAWPQILPIVKSAVDIAMQVGLPEARIPLADAVVLVSTAPKSNSAYRAINEAVSDVQQGNIGPVPRQLQNMHYDGADQKRKGQHYLYAHDFDHHWVQQQYLPDALKDRVYYEYGDNKNEQAFKAYWGKIKK